MFGEIILLHEKQTKSYLSKEMAYLLYNQLRRQLDKRKRKMHQLAPSVASTCPTTGAG